MRILLALACFFEAATCSALDSEELGRESLPQYRVQEREAYPVVRPLPAWPSRLPVDCSGEGIVVLFDVKRIGVVSRVSIETTLDDGEFSDELVEHLMRWRFVPTIRSGEPIRTKNFRWELTLAEDFELCDVGEN